MYQDQDAISSLQVDAGSTSLTDEHLMALNREQILELPAQSRMRWFSLLQVEHAELVRVIDQLEELLDPENEVKIISIIGPTGIGKTTLAKTILTKLVSGMSVNRKAHEVPVVYVCAPANGEKSMSWKALYRRIKIAAGELYVDMQRPVEVRDGELHALRSQRQSLAHLREELETVIKHRNVRVLVIDEAMHLLRFNENTAIMDTLKSLADIHQTKLVLIGTYQIAPLMIEYGQLARRSAILHYKRYAKPASRNRSADDLSKAERNFLEAVSRIQQQWPCARVPNLVAIWEQLMQLSLGSVGLLKSQLLQLASLQMSRKGEALLETDLQRAFKPPKQLRKIENETVQGEEELEGACYGEADFGDATAVAQLFARLTKKEVANA
ncbi:MAG: AAA family ATPase [Rubrivivax sp.]